VIKINESNVIDFSKLSNLPKIRNRKEARVLEKALRKAGKSDKEIKHLVSLCKELMRGVDRAKTITVSALRTAIMVASALYNQKIVLQKIQVLNETTNNMISATSQMLKQQGTEVNRNAIESSISVDTLKQAFSDVLGALDEISSFKMIALPQMRRTIQEFKNLADEGENRISMIEKGNIYGLLEG
jgi:uncharacterized protein YaaN involved in tellurite resistance